jgi:hypothetical protein
MLSRFVRAARNVLPVQKPGAPKLLQPGLWKNSEFVIATAIVTPARELHMHNVPCACRTLADVTP